MRFNDTLKMEEIVIIKWEIDKKKNTKMQIKLQTQDN